jgi:hypothetical protein
MMDFELAVSQQVARVKVLEKALHEKGPWAFRLGDTAADGTVSYIHGVPAQRRIEPEAMRVVFSAELFSHYDQETRVDLMTMRDRELVSTRTVHLPMGRSLMEWELSIPQTVTA